MQRKLKDSIWPFSYKVIEFNGHHDEINQFAFASSIRTIVNEDRVFFTLITSQLLILTFNMLYALSH